MSKLISAKCLFLILALAAPASCPRGDDRIFAPVPAEQRARFKERLALYIQYTRGDEDKEDKLYGLYDEQTLCSLCRGKAECVRDCVPPMTMDLPKGARVRLLKLKPIAVEPVPGEPGRYKIEVEQKQRVTYDTGERSRIWKKTVSIYATFQNGDWYFSLIYEPGILLL